MYLYIIRIYLSVWNPLYIISTIFVNKSRRFVKKGQIFENNEKAPGTFCHDTCRVAKCNINVTNDLICVKSNIAVMIC